MHLRGGQCAGVQGLLTNLCGEVDLIRRRADAGAELHLQVGRLGAVMLPHLGDGIGGDAQFRPFFARVHHAKGTGTRIRQINRAAVGDVDADDQAACVGYKTVCS